jgi:hypothetical protein
MALLVASCSDDGPATSADSGSSTTTASDGPSTSASVGTTTTVAAELVKLTPTSLGALTIGMSQEAATATGMIEPFGPGCELAGPGQKAAELKAPLDGSVIADETGVTRLYVRAGAITDPGAVQVGDALSEVRKAFGDAYTVTVDQDPDTVAMFGAWFAYVAKAGVEDSNIFQVSVDPGTELVTALGAPYIPTCE